MRGFLLAPVHHNGEVHLTFDVRPAFDINSANGVPLYVHAQDLLGRLFGILRAIHHFDAPGLAPAANEDLCLHRDRAADLLGRMLCLLRRFGYAAFQRLEAVPLQQLFALILVEIQNSTPREALADGGNYTEAARRRFYRGVSLSPATGPLIAPLEVARDAGHDQLRLRTARPLHLRDELSGFVSFQRRHLLATPVDKDFVVFAGTV